MKSAWSAVLALMIVSTDSVLAQTSAPASAPSAESSVDRALAGAGMPGPPAALRGPDGRFLIASAPSVDLAVEAAKSAAASCAPHHVGVVILDAAGLPKLYYVTDGASGVHAYTAFRKANTALLIAAPSEQLKARMAADRALANKVSAAPNNYIAWAGGLPIRVDGHLIGAIGVSGAGPSEIDKGCAEAGLNAVQGRLK